MRNTQLINRLTSLKQTPLAPDWMLAAVTYTALSEMIGNSDDLRNVRREARQVQETRERLNLVAPRWPRAESTLL